jgi:hypothetical protein
MDPNPIKHQAVLLAHIRDAIEPSLIAAGFHFDARNKPPANHGYSLWIDYVRDGEMFSIRCDRWIARLAAETLDSQGRVLIVAEVHFNRPRTHNELMDEVTPFIARINGFLDQSAGSSCKVDDPPASSQP